MAFFGPSKATQLSMKKTADAVDAARAQQQTAAQAGLEFKQGFGQRNRQLLEFQKRTGKQVADYMSGKDISGVFRGQREVYDTVANQGRRIMEITGGLGSNALSKSDRYVKKLQSLAVDKLFRGASREFAAGAGRQHESNVQNLANIQGMLTQDRLSGLQALNQGFANAASLAGLNTNLAQLNMQGDAAKRAGILGIANLGIGAFTGIGGVLKT